MSPKPHHGSCVCNYSRVNTLEPENIKTLVTLIDAYKTKLSEHPRRDILMESVAFLTHLYSPKNYKLKFLSLVFFFYRLNQQDSNKPALSCLQTWFWTLESSSPNKKRSGSNQADTAGGVW